MDLFKEISKKCDGCPILKYPLPSHSIMDYEFEDEKEILFVSDSPKMMEGQYSPFRPLEFKLIRTLLSNLGISRSKIGFTSAVKCPNMTADSMDKTARKLCREHLKDTIAQYKPKLVFACGKLATTMFYGKNVKDTKVRGKPVEFSFDDEHKFKLVSVLHPWQIVLEPKNEYLFNVDIENAIRSEILGISNKKEVKYTIVTSEEVLNIEKECFLNTTDPIAVDIETTGLNFLEDNIHTVAITRINPDSGEVIRTIVLPIDHPEAAIPLKLKAKFIDFLNKILASNNRKILQKATFDLKFLMRYGVKNINNIWDIRLIQHLYNEDVPKSLHDLVSYYFPDEL